MHDLIRYLWQAPDLDLSIWALEVLDLILSALQVSSTVICSRTLLFYNLHTAPLSCIINCFGVQLQQYTYLTYIVLPPTDQSSKVKLDSRLSTLSTVHAWFYFSCLAVNADKCEAIINPTMTLRALLFCCSKLSKHLV